MSHFTVLVIGEGYEEQLAPYNEDISVAPYRDYQDEDTLAWQRKLYADDHQGAEPPSDEALVKFLNEKWGEDGLKLDEKGIYRLSTYNPASKWDWYQVGGRWRGFFKLKEGITIGASQVGQPGTFGNEPENDADVVHKGDVDIEGMRDTAGEAAGELWDKAQAVLNGLPAAKPWAEFVEEVKAEKITIEDARSTYHAQERCKALREAGDELGWRSPEEFEGTRDAFVQQARDEALSTYAYVKDGEWFAPGRMGWFGMSSENDTEKQRFVREFNEMLDALPDDTLLTLVDCHI